MVLHEAGKTAMLKGWALRCSCQHAGTPPVRHHTIRSTTPSANRHRGRRLTELIPNASLSHGIRLKPVRMRATPLLRPRVLRQGANFTHRVNVPTATRRAHVSGRGRVLCYDCGWRLRSGCCSGSVCFWRLRSAG